MPAVLEINNYESATKISREFLICDFCFWAASAISTRRGDIVGCPQCNRNISRIPLTIGESVAFNYDSRRGVELAFNGR